jgi:hypothetical protein
VDIADVKKELSGDEKVLESVFKIETLYKKHKYKIWGIAAAIVLFFGAKTIQENMHQSQLESANEAFLVLQKKPNDAAALAKLQENNPKLLALFQYAQAVKAKDVKTLTTLSHNQNDVIADASHYAVSVLDKKPVDSKLYHKLVLFEEGYLALQSGNEKLAKEKLELIDERSSLFVLSQFLKHATIEVK